jgi:hypothetical protein
LELGLDAYAGEDAQLLAAPHVHMKNLLAMPGGIEPDGVPIELSRVKLPACFVSTVEDRIAPWKMTYKGAKHAEYESQAQQEHDRPAPLMIFSTLTAARRNK